MKLIVDQFRAIAHIRLDGHSALMLPRIEGRKIWMLSGALSFEPTAANIEVFREFYPTILLDDRRPSKVRPTSPKGKSAPVYIPKVKPYAKQAECFEQNKDMPAFAIFAEQGTGKSKMALDKTGHLFVNGLITALLVITPNYGIAEQWVDEAVPMHLGSQVPWVGHVYSRRELPDGLYKADTLSILTINIDAVKTPTGANAVASFIRHHAGRVHAVIDESDIIRHHRSGRSKTMYTLAPLVSHRMILTGTPIAKELSDEWAQFKFLDESIIGIRYLTAFRAMYCVMGGYEFRKVVAHKNLDHFQARVRPYVFRVLKEQMLDLPPKVYNKFTFDMGDDQKRAFKELKKTFLLQLDNGTISSVANAAVLMMRLQQISCGYLPMDDGSVLKFGNPRLAALRDLLEVRKGKVVIWARFTRDIVNIKLELGEAAVTYNGQASQRDKQQAKERFINDPTVTYFIGNQAAAGRGLDGLQKVSGTAIYYSNSFNSIDRWQSEDRIHRSGSMAGDSVDYFDLIAKGTPDLRILTVLRQNRSLSDLVLGDIREMLL